MQIADARELPRSWRLLNLQGEFSQAAGQGQREVSNSSLGVALGSVCGVAASVEMTEIFLMLGIKQSHQLPFLRWEEGASQRLTELGFRQAGFGLRGDFLWEKSKGFCCLTGGEGFRLQLRCAAASLLHHIV